MLDCSDREGFISLTLPRQQDIPVLVVLESKTIVSVSEKLVYGGRRSGCYLNNRADTYNFN